MLPNLFSLLPIPGQLPTLSMPAAATINHLLAQEDWARAELKQYAGKVARIDASPVELRLMVAADGMVQAASSDVVPAVTIRLKLSDLPLIAQNRERAFSYVQIEGDAEFANAISRLSQSLRWEAEHDLEKLVGPIAAVRLVAGAKGALASLQTGQRKLTENVAEYFLEEQPLLVRPAVTEPFAADVTRLRDDVERAIKRLEKLEQKFAQRQPNQAPAGTTPHTETR
ncbi:ubiquinone biosynthesis accessory factor UbiJ [Pseudoduganella chitinolytica]|uniref:Ubiquinone biosynthesis accessory factor UbiJ n=1 Tax=Pseudoduganella chitinolytica TaxID=34070 RepID=A0ABY8BCY8_9BURK|nr:SCP2 sterol-binding domain-containing protein [Pseudoduganella chitinolytica]WEF32602.1 SCP2 sterol-binding domain-containing protein [Pseudoduganella chitinolytica]